MKHLVFFIVLAIPLFVHAETYEPKDVSEIRAQYNLLVDLRNAREISEEVFIEKTDHLKALAEQKFNVNLEGLGLQQLVSAQKIDWVTYALYVVSVLVILAILIPLIKRIMSYFIYLFNRVVRFFQNNRFIIALLNKIVSFLKRAWEPCAYILIALVLYIFQNEYIVLLTSVLSGALLTYSVLSRNENYKRSRRVKMTSWLLTALWGGLAYFFNNAFIGFITVAAFVTSLGFEFLMLPGMISIGFRKNEPLFVIRLTGIAFLLSVFSWLLFYTGFVPALDVIRNSLGVFKTGMVSLVPLVFFTGLGYMSFFLYRRKPVVRILCELLALACGTAVLILSLMYEISSMFWIGLIFMFWDLVDKYYELVFKRVDIVFAGLILACVLAGMGHFIQSYRLVIMEALKFLII